MRAIFYTTLLICTTFFAASCVKKTKPEVESSSVIVHDGGTPARSGEGQDSRQRLDEIGMGGDVKREKQNVKVVNTGDVQKLKKYSVVVATLTKQKGITALQRFFDRDGIQHFVIKNPQGRYYFVIASSDSEEVAMEARANFLIEHTVNKSRKDIWEQYYIQLTDTFILEKE